MDRHGDSVHVVARDAYGDTTAYETEGAVVTVGAWTKSLLERLLELPKLTVTEEHPAHFKFRDGFQEAEGPSFNHFSREIPGKNGRVGAAYGMYRPGEGVKVGFHLVGTATPPD